LVDSRQSTKANRVIGRLALVKRPRRKSEATPIDITGDSASRSMPDIDDAVASVFAAGGTSLYDLLPQKTLEEPSSALSLIPLPKLVPAASFDQKVDDATVIEVETATTRTPEPSDRTQKPAEPTDLGGQLIGLLKDHFTDIPTTLILLLIVAVIGALFLADNDKGWLNTWAGLEWFFMKMLSITALSGVLLVLLAWLIRKQENKLGMTIAGCCIFFASIVGMTVMRDVAKVNPPEHSQEPAKEKASQANDK